MNQDINLEPVDDNDDSEGEDESHQPANEGEYNDVFYVNNQGQRRCLRPKFASMTAEPLMWDVSINFHPSRYVTAVTELEKLPHSVRSICFN